MDPELKQHARTALGQLAKREAELEQQHPGCWDQLERLRTAPGDLTWPEWCLLPMAAPATLIQSTGIADPRSIPLLSALHAWRFTRSVYLFEPTLANVLLQKVPEAIRVDDLAGLPEWCVCLPGDPETGLGLVLAHLEHDVNTSRPELRLLVQTGERDFLPIPVYLDRDGTTQALADARATNMAPLGARGVNVRGADPDATAAMMAERVDGWISVLLYLASGEADLVHADRPGVRPVKPRRPKQTTDVWLVGYQQ